MDLNIPWTESPFFEVGLSKRQNLTEQERQEAKFYNENGYLLLSGILSDEIIDDVRDDLEKQTEVFFTKDDPRAMDLWKRSNAVKQLAEHPAILKKLQLLYGREPIPFQTLNFSSGSEQKPHSDTMHFNSFPARFMCAAWVALEDMDEENGTVIYYPGSHKLPVYDYSFLSSHFNTSDGLPKDFYVTHYEPFIQKLMASEGIEPKPLIVKKGDILIWSANLIHGGLPVKDKSRSRWSQVTHYYFENCLYYTPQLSNAVGGEWYLRKIQNIKTGAFTWGSYNGYKPKRKVVPNYRYLISPYAPYNWRDIGFIFTRLYYRFFKRS